MGIEPQRLRVVSNGFDPFFAQILPESERVALLARFRLPRDHPLMLFVGNHTANKGLDVLLKALPNMQEHAVAVIAGAIRSRQEHEQLLTSSGVSNFGDRLCFTDFITKEELRALYQTVDLFVFPTRADTLPLVVLEAMVSNLPVVSTTVGGIPYEVTPDTGMLVEPGDPVALARALDHLCANPPLRRQMGDAARARVLKTFDWELSARQAVDIYREIITEKRQ